MKTYRKPKGHHLDADLRRALAEKALQYLLAARDAAGAAGCGYLIPRINAAISSARGALRNAINRLAKIA